MRLLTALVSSLLAAGLAGPRSTATVIVIKAARLIDGRGGPPMEPATVLIEGARIAEVALASRSLLVRA